MSLDVVTLFVAAVCVAALLAFFLFFAWIQDRKVQALAWWGAAYLLGGAGVALRAIEAALSLPLPRGLPSALLFVACGIAWNGARLFQNQPSRPLALCAGGIIWLAASQAPLFAQSGSNRIALSAGIVSVYALLTARELWRERRNRRRARLAAVLVPLLHGFIFLPPLVLTLMRHETQDALLSSGWMAAFTLEALLYAMGTALLVLMTVKERVAHIHRTAAMTDMLTGLLNRRGLLQSVQALIDHKRGRGRVTALMFDLDHFKSINDRFGHAVGDDALRVFASTISKTMREDDLIGRLGGEEFAAILPVAMADGAIAAERVRAAFEAAGVEISGRNVGATVSIGAADADAHGCDIDRLLGRADSALYAAKRAGRNRIAYAPEPAASIPPPAAESEADPVLDGASLTA